MGITTIDIRRVYVLEFLEPMKTTKRKKIIDGVWNYPEYIREFKEAGVQIKKNIDWAVSDLSKEPGICHDKEKKCYQATSLQALDAALEKIIDSALEIYVDDVTDDIIEIVYPGTVGLSEQVISRILKKLGKSVYDYPNASIVF